jgi:hypothetical protein
MVSCTWERGVNVINKLLGCSVVLLVAPLCKRAVSLCDVGFVAWSTVIRNARFWARKRAYPDSSGKLSPKTQKSIILESQNIAIVFQSDTYHHFQLTLWSRDWSLNYLCVYYSTWEFQLMYILILRGEQHMLEKNENNYSIGSSVSKELGFHEYLAEFLLPLRRSPRGFEVSHIKSKCV